MERVPKFTTENGHPTIDGASTFSLLSFARYRQLRREINPRTREKLTDGLRAQGLSDEFMDCYTNDGLRIITNESHGRHMTRGETVKSAQAKRSRS